MILPKLILLGALSTQAFANPSPDDNAIIKPAEARRIDPVLNARDEAEFNRREAAEAANALKERADRIAERGYGSRFGSSVGKGAALGAGIGVGIGIGSHHADNKHKKNSSSTPSAVTMGYSGTAAFIAAAVFAST